MEGTGREEKFKQLRYSCMELYTGCQVSTMMAMDTSSCPCEHRSGWWGGLGSAGEGRDGAESCLTGVLAAVCC
jgi:hypothetical protein